MPSEKVINERIRMITDCILKDYECRRDIDKMDVFSQPDSEAVTDIVKKLLNILYPGYYRERYYRSYNDNSRISILIEDVMYNLSKQIAIALRFSGENEDASDDDLQKLAESKVICFLGKIPKIREYLNTDMEAFFDGDPAAYHKEEVVLCYPGFLAISINRLAHELFLLQVPMIPRMMTEYAHSKTGIDIHPGATIGKYFFMDHGTGIVIGETSIIGEHVKIYQGVTIGALSTKGGQRLRGVRRHPTIEDDVTIYAGASILGGETVIGKGSVIGSNVFITSSVKPGTRMSVKTQELLVKQSDDIEGPREEAEPGQSDNWYYVI